VPTENSNANLLINEFSIQKKGMVEEEKRKEDDSLTLRDPNSGLSKYREHE